LRYPPYAHLPRVVCSAEAAESAHRAAAEVLHGLGPIDGSVLGPAPLFRLRGRERTQLVIKAQDRGGAIRAAGKAVSRAAADSAHAGVSFSVDVDPQ
jgi:primosomal protein N' (replication factor Y)